MRPLAPPVVRLHCASGRVARRLSTVRYVGIAALAAISAVASGSAQLAPGQYRAMLAAPSHRQLAGRATYTRCGNILHIWLADTLSAGFALEFGTSARTLGPRRFLLAPIELLSPARPWPPPYFRVFVPPDTLLFAGSGELRLTGVQGRQMAGEFHVAVSDAWSGSSQIAGFVVGRFHALRDTIRERAFYRGARCDRPGEEWPRVE